MRIKIADVKFGDRQRTDLGDLLELADSLKKYGQLQAIGVDTDNNLVWGGRRFAASQINEVETIEAVVVDADSTLKLKILEFEENNQRKDLTPEEEDKAIRGLHQLMVEANPIEVDPKKRGRRKTQWSMDDTAKLIGQSRPRVSRKIHHANKMAELPEDIRVEIYEKGGSSRRAVETALTQYERDSNRKTQIALEQAKRKIEGPTNVDKIVQCIDAREGLRAIQTESVDLIITDPPYGVLEESAWDKQFGTGHTTRNFDDDYESTIKLLTDIMPELYRVMKNGSHLYMFCSLVPKDFSQPDTIPHASLIGRLMQEAGFMVRPGPLIWHKSSSQGFAPNYTVWPFNIEGILFARKGWRDLDSKMPVEELLSYPPIHSTNKQHKTEKPTQLIRAMCTRSQVRDGLFLDPFCGSGSGLMAALLTMDVLGFDLDPEAVEVSKQRISKHPKLR